MRRFIVAPVAAAALVGGAVAMASPAGAAGNTEVFPIACSDGQTYTIENSGNGEFTPGRIVGSTSVGIPVAFGETTFRAVAPDGTVIFEESEPGVAKGNGNVAAHNPASTMDCTFTLSFTGDPGLPPGTVVTVSGTVTVFVTPRG